MSNKETLQSYNKNLGKNNETLASILNTINNLPEAGSGDGDNKLLASYIATIDTSRGENITIIPDGVTNIGAGKYQNKYDMKITKLPDTIQTIGDTAFASCQQMAISKLPLLLVSAGKNAFSGCQSITELTAYENAVDFGQYCFNCVNLKKITFLASTVKLGNYCFTGATNITAILMPNLTGVPNISTVAFTTSGITSNKGFVYVPDDLLEDIKTGISNYANYFKGMSEYTE